MFRQILKLSWFLALVVIFVGGNTKAQFPILTDESEIGLILDCLEKAIQKTDTSDIYSMLGPQISVKGKTTDPRFQIHSIFERAGHRKTIMSPSGVAEKIGNFWDLEIKVLEIKFTNDSTEAVANCQLKLWAAEADTPRTIKTTSESFKFRKTDDKGWRLVGFDNLFDFLEKEVNLGKHVLIPIPVKLTGSVGRPVIEASALKEGSPKVENGYSDYALIQIKVFENPDVWHLTKGYANSEWGVDLFAYPYSSCADYLLVDTTLYTAVTFISDYAFHRIIYIECYSDWIRAYGSFGSGDGQFNSPSGIDCEYDHDEGGNYYVYVADTWNNRIVTLKYDWQSEQMSWLRSITGNGLVLLKDIDINNGGDFNYRPNDKIWVANGDNTIKKFDLNGNLLLEFGYFEDLRGIACGRSYFITNPPYEHFADNNDLYVLEGRYMHQYRETPPGNIQWVRDVMIGPLCDPPCPWPVRMTSLDVDNFGQVWTTEVDTTDESSEVVKYTPDLSELCRFNAGGSFNRLQNFSNTGGKRGCGDAFVLEEWDDESGGLYYAIGTDLLDVSTGSDSSHKFHYIGYTLVDPAFIAVKVYNQAGTLVKTVKDTINPYFPDFSGVGLEYWWDGTDNSNHIVPSGNYRIEITAYSVYVNINTNQHVNIVSKDGWVYHIDYSAPLNTPNITSITAVDTCLRFEWDDNNNNELGYIIERKDATNEQWSVIDTTTWDVESYTDYQIMGSETYDYRIKAYNYFHTTICSNTVSKRAHPHPPEIIYVENWYCNRHTWPVGKMTPSEDEIRPIQISTKCDCSSPYPDSIPSNLSVIYVDYPTNQKPGTYAKMGARTKSCQWYNWNYVSPETIIVDLQYHRILIHTPPDTNCSDWTYYFQVRTRDIYGDTSMWLPQPWGWPYACCVGPCHVPFGPTPVCLKPEIPDAFYLEQNHPNPFNPETQIRYALPQATRVKLVLYNVLGQKVRTLVDEYQTAGYRTTHWDGKDESGNDLASGIYFYRLQAGEYNEVRKMIMLK